ncbi:MAG: UPF0175 family protein [Thermoflexales bacterium]|nr:UPF0175 family protein [Thermoflexales bacterium]
MAIADNLLEERDLIGWQLRQLVASGLYPDEQAVLRNALQALFQVHPRTKTAMIISAYERGDISLGRAAVLLGISQEEMKDILREAGAQIQLGPRTAEECIEDVRYA